MEKIFEPLTFKRGPAIKNRLMLAPLTNCQSDPIDGTILQDEINWLSLRAKGGFGMTMTGGANVQFNGRGFRQQLGIYSDKHIDGLTRLASAIKKYNSVSSLQLHHAGMRSTADMNGECSVGPSDDEKTGTKALSTTEVENLIEDFIQAAIRAEKAGFDGIELHGAHGYIICAFLSSVYNRRTDHFGGSLENRSRIVFDIVQGIRNRCNKDFQIGVRLSPERFGMDIAEIQQVSQRLIDTGQIDYLDFSLWEVFKEPYDNVYKGRDLISYFTELDRGDVRLSVSGKVKCVSDIEKCIDLNVDFLSIGRAGILHHDFPKRIEKDRRFISLEFPVSRDYLRSEGIGDSFIEYLSTWPKYVL